MGTGTEDVGGFLSAEAGVEGRAGKDSTFARGGRVGVAVAIGRLGRLGSAEETVGADGEEVDDAVALSRRGEAAVGAGILPMEGRLRTGAFVVVAFVVEVAATGEAEPEGEAEPGGEDEEGGLRFALSVAAEGDVEGREAGGVVDGGVEDGGAEVVGGVELTGGDADSRRELAAD